MKWRVAVAGACGRMGRRIVKAVAEEEDMELALAIDLRDLGRDAGEIAGIQQLSVPIASPEHLAAKLHSSGSQVLVDFTTPAAAAENAMAAIEAGVNLVMGTTGLKREDMALIERGVREKGVSAVVSPNMATGVNVFFKLVRDAASALGGEYDVEILELHHRRKKDAPSGTALRAAELIASALGLDLERSAVFGRRGVVGERKSGEIGLHALRAGDVVGEHTVVFAGDGERIEITHRAHSRDAFVRGVVKAIRFLMEKGEEGRVYTTWDVLGIR